MSCKQYSILLFANNKKIKCSLRNTEFGIRKDQTVDHGFAPLKKLLPIWMNEKLKDMENDVEQYKKIMKSGIFEKIFKNFYEKT